MPWRADRGGVYSGSMMPRKREAPQAATSAQQTALRTVSCPLLTVQAAAMHRPPGFGSMERASMPGIKLSVAAQPQQRHAMLPQIPSPGGRPSQPQVQGPSGGPGTHPRNTRFRRNTAHDTMPKDQEQTVLSMGLADVAISGTSNTPRNRPRRSSRPGTGQHQPSSSASDRGGNVVDSWLHSGSSSSSGFGQKTKLNDGRKEPRRASFPDKEIAHRESSGLTPGIYYDQYKALLAAAQASGTSEGGASHEDINDRKWHEKQNLEGNGKTADSSGANTLSRCNSLSARPERGEASREREPELMDRNRVVMLDGSGSCLAIAMKQISALQNRPAEYWEQMHQSRSTDDAPAAASSPKAASPKTPKLAPPSPGGASASGGSTRKSTARSTAGSEVGSREEDPGLEEDGSDEEEDDDDDDEADPEQEDADVDADADDQDDDDDEDDDDDDDDEDEDEDETAASGTEGEASIAEGKVKKAYNVSCNLRDARYDVIREIAKELNYKIVKGSGTVDFIWKDARLDYNMFRSLKPYQKINHFPHMTELAQKANLGRNLRRMAKMFPKCYDFFPRTFVLPSDYELLMSNKAQYPKQIYICKPEFGSQGRGIYLTSTLKEIKDAGKENRAVVQHYMAKPFLIDNYKFDLRVYILVTSVSPLSAFMFHEGLARFCTEEYQKPNAKNLDSSFMHLTNYAINKNNECFEAADDCSDGDSGFKRSLSSVIERTCQMLTADEPDPETACKARTQRMWKDIEEVCAKTLLAGTPGIAHMFKALFRGSTNGFNCFEVLGFDVMLDEQGVPMLIEVNNLPSFETETALDVEVKRGLIHDVFVMVGGENVARSKFFKDKQQAVHNRMYGDSLAQGAAKKEFMRKAIDEREEKNGRKLTKEERESEIEKQRHALKDMERDRKKNEKSAKHEAHMSAVRERFAYEDANLGGFSRMFPDRLNRYEEFERAGASISRDTASLKQRKEEAQAEAREREKKRKEKRITHPFEEEE